MRSPLLRKKMYKIICFILLVLLTFLVDKAFSEVIKTIDDDIIEGEVLNADEEYLSIRQGHDNITFIQWRIVRLISRDREIIIVRHDGGVTEFTIITTTTDNLSARDVGITTTDKISSIYPKEVLTQRLSFLNEDEQSVPLDTDDKINIDAVSQQNIAAKDKLWKGNVDAGLTFQTGNQEAVTASLKTGFSWERKKDNLYLNGLLLFGKKDGEKNADEQRGVFKYERKHKERLYSFHQENLEHDEIERLNLRSITSSGMGYRFIEKKDLKYRSEIGPSLIYERFMNGVTKVNPGLKIGNYLDWQIYDSTKIYFNVDFLPSPNDFIKWRLESDVGLRHNLNKNLSFNINWLDQYDSEPVSGVNHNDATILSTIGYNF